MVSIPYVQRLSESSNETEFSHSFQAREKGEAHKAKSQQPLGDKRKAVVYKISCKCNEAVYWGEARVVALEYGLRQRKAREGIESLREKSSGKVVINNYEPLTTWRPTLDRYLDSESKNACMSTRV